MKPVGRLLFLSLAVLFATPALAKQQVACTLVVEVGSDTPLLQEGNCNGTVSAASTFKIAIALMGFDTGILASANSPVWPYKDGYPDWNPKWKQDHTPRTWMRDSVVWYSQQITTKLGEERFARYVDAFDYGNRDVTGDKGKANGITNAWLSSSLQISPAQEVAFLTRMLSGKLPVSPESVAKATILLDNGAQSNGWHLYGKTGAGMQQKTDGTPIRGKPFGWFVGWAEHGDRKVVFARLMRFTERPSSSTPAFIARDGLKEALFGPNGILD